MLWFRLGGMVALTITFVIAMGMLCAVGIMVINPNNDRGMDTAPYYNGTLFYYLLVILAEMAMVAATIFGYILAFKVWKNNLQLDHTLRHKFTIWLSIIASSTMTLFIIGILGMVRIREAQEEITSLYEIFSKYNQDVKFVGSFERFQREHSCCGVTGANDWMASQYKSGSGNEMAMAGMGGMDMYGGFGMGSPSTGKCHLTLPTIPLGCGKKIIEILRYAQSIYGAILIMETAFSIVAAVLAWYSFFYWIEKEVIIIPEDEVSNLIVIEPESSKTTLESSVKSGSTHIPSEYFSERFSGTGSQHTQYTHFSGSRNSGSRHTGSRHTGSYHSGSYRPETSREHTINQSHHTEEYNGSRRSYIPNTRRQTNVSQFSNFHGSVPSVGGPSAQYHHSDRSDGHRSGQREEEYHVSYRQSEPSYHTYRQSTRRSRESDPRRTRSTVNARNTRSHHTVPRSQVNRESYNRQESRNRRESQY